MLYSRGSNNNGGGAYITRLQIIITSVYANCVHIKSYVTSIGVKSAKNIILRYFQANYNKDYNYTNTL